MRMHLNRETLLALAEGNVRARSRHLDACARCRKELERLRETLADVREVDASEPSPLFFEQLSARVGQAIREEAPLAPAWQGFTWRSLVPSSLAAAVVVGGVLLTLPGVERPPLAVEVATSAPLEGAEETTGEEGGWLLFTELAGDVDGETVEETGLRPSPAFVEDALLATLTAEERKELTVLLRDKGERSPLEDRR